MNAAHISVRISMLDLFSFPAYTDESLFQMYILGRLRAADIPIKGLLVFGGVSSGRLYERIDFEGNMLYDWYAGAENA